MFGKLFIIASLLIVGVATACGAGAASSPTASPLEPNFVITVADQYSGDRSSLVTLIDLSTGETLAQVTAGDQPWPLFRPSSGELLVSDFGGRDFKPRLRVFDIQDTSAPKWTMRLPNRADSTLWAPAWALSADERYLYYAAHPPAPADHFPNWIGIIDLDSAGLIDRARLPLGCGGYKTLTAIDGSKAQVFCSARRFVTVNPAGVVSDFAPFSWPEKAIASLARPTATPSPGLSRPLWRPADPLIRGCAGGGSPCPLSESRRVLSYRLREAQSLSGLLAYDEEQPADAQLYDLSEGITHFTPVNANTVALLDYHDATIYLLDLGTGSIRNELPAPSGASRLVGPLLGGEPR